MKSLLRFFRLLTGQRRPRGSNDMLNLIFGRKSCRRFRAISVDRSIIDEVLRVGALTPSTVNLQTWSFFPFLADEWKNTFGAGIPFGAQAAIIVAADLERLKIVDDVYRRYPLFFYTLAVMNASLAAMNMTVAIEALGLKSIMLSQTGRTGIMDMQFLRDRLSMPELVFPLTTIAFGYPEDPVLFSPPKLDVSTVVHQGQYGVDRDAVIEWFNQMDLVCRMVDREHMTEKFDKYLKMLPAAEEELSRAFEKIKA